MVVYLLLYQRTLSTLFTPSLVGACKQVEGFSGLMTGTHPAISVSRMIRIISSRPYFVIYARLCAVADQPLPPRLITKFTRIYMLAVIPEQAGCDTRATESGPSTIAVAVLYLPWDPVHHHLHTLRSHAHDLRQLRWILCISSLITSRTRPNIPPPACHEMEPQDHPRHSQHHEPPER